MAFITVQNIVKEYSGTKALNNVSFDVEAGSIFGLLGPNGAGKTTIIRIINQILAPDSGKVLFNGEPITAAHIGRIGYLPEERGLYKKMKIGEQLVYLAQLKEMPKAIATEKLKSWFQKFEIENWWDKNVEELSKGMQQKVQFIATVLHEPELLIFDEPFSGFDPINALAIKQEILALKDKGITIILSTHTMSSVEELCDSIALIHKGQKVLDGKVFDIKQKYSNNTYEIKCSGWFDSMASTLTHNYQIIDHHKEGNITTVKLKLLNNIPTNDLIRHFTGLGNVIAFNELLPSMNDIFIDVVGETNKQTGA
jgi:ABC-2 type transport system ATP-binding protein